MESLLEGLWDKRLLYSLGVRSLVIRLREIRVLLLVYFLLIVFWLFI